jgi:hypothetical protein
VGLFEFLEKSAIEKASPQAFLGKQATSQAELR